MTDHQRVIERTVTAFYAKARTDILIGYHFERILDFSAHLPRIIAFWELQLLGETSYQFEPPLDALRAHIPLKVHRGEINRWVKLFLATLESEVTDEAFKGLWQEKLRHFQQIFLRSPVLFASPD